MARALIFSGTSQVEALGIKNRLNEEGISFFEINKMDSSYAGVIGEIEIYVNTEDETKTLAVLSSLSTE
ncbi:putative signal transducing protein [Lacinutrix undariae]